MNNLLSPLAGKPAPKGMLVDLGRLEREYYERQPDYADPNQRVSFGTSGHRGTSLRGTFTEAHILAITQAICEFRRMKGTDGPLYLGKDTHALSGPAQRTALEVLPANQVWTILQRDDGVTPTPVISRAILVHNRGRQQRLADGIVITPSHNPPEDGGLKYDPTNGGPADTDITHWIENRANELLKGKNADVRRLPFAKAVKAPTSHQEDLIWPYVQDLEQVVDMAAIRHAGLKLAVDPMGGAALPYWEPINTRYGLDIAVVNSKLDPTFSFMTVDHDGKIRMDCSSPYAMAGLVGLKDQYRVAFGNDPDADRHGIVTPSAGLMNPNHFLAAAIRYLLAHRPCWRAQAAIGKTLVSSSIIDRVVGDCGRRLCEVPVGFKWFAPGLFDGSLCFGGEESAGASFLCRDGTVWTTDKDGLIMGLLAAELTAVTGKEPGEHFREISERFGQPYYTRLDVPASAEQKAVLASLSPDAVKESQLAGEPITARLTRAPGNNAPIGGLKVVATNGWFAARPSGTENVLKIYAESLVSQQHLDAIMAEARQIVDNALTSSAPGVRAGKGGQ
jgi:phosphoglucomutase